MRSFMAWLVTLSAAASALAAGATEQPVTLHTPTGALAGTLLRPAADGPVPLAVIVAGSGPTDRDGNTLGLPGRNDSLRLLAQALAERGVATLRYDKRGIGGSAAAARAEQDLRFDDLVADAAAWVERHAGDARFSGVALLGHSEGALIGLQAARQARARAYVSVAGVGTPATQQLRRQLAGRLPPELAARSEALLSGLESGRLSDDVPPPLMALYRPSVQPYLVSWFRVDPAAALAALPLPCLIVQGDTDLQVTPADARALHAAQPSCGLQIVEGMNHVLKSVPADAGRQQASYLDPTLPLAPGLADGIARFLREALPSPRR